VKGLCGDLRQSFRPARSSYFLSSQTESVHILIARLRIALVVSGASRDSRVPEANACRVLYGVIFDMNTSKPRRTVHGSRSPRVFNANIRGSLHNTPQEHPGSRLQILATEVFPQSSQMRSRDVSLLGPSRPRQLQHKTAIDLEKKTTSRRPAFQYIICDPC